MPSVYFLTVSQPVRLLFLGIESGKWEDTEFSLIHRKSDFVFDFRVG